MKNLPHLLHLGAAMYIRSLEVHMEYVPDIKPVIIASVQTASLVKILDNGAFTDLDSAIRGTGIKASRRTMDAGDQSCVSNIKLGQGF